MHDHRFKALEMALLYARDQHMTPDDLITLAGRFADFLEEMPHDAAPAPVATPAPTETPAPVETAPPAPPAPPVAPVEEPPAPVSTPTDGTAQPS